MNDDLSFLTEGPSKQPAAVADPFEFLGQPNEFEPTLATSATAQAEPEPPPLSERAATVGGARTRREHLALIKARTDAKTQAWSVFDKERGRVLAGYLRCIDERGKEAADCIGLGAAYLSLEKNHAEAVAALAAAKRGFDDFLAGGCIAPAETDEQEAARRLAAYQRLEAAGGLGLGLRGVEHDPGGPGKAGKSAGVGRQIDRPHG